MAFTNIEIIRKHLSEFTRSIAQVENLAIRFAGSLVVDLPHVGIRAGTETVKGLESDLPSFEQVCLPENGVNLAHAYLVGESVVVAKDQSLTAVYQENVDYIVDYKLGKLRRLAAGVISEGQQVGVWYVHFRLYSRSVDYALDYAAGRLSRLATGAIQDGQSVWVDYEVEAGGFSDAAVERAIEEAHAQVVSQIDEEYLEVPDSQLEVAETYLALEILARVKSFEVLQSGDVNPALKGSQAAEYLKVGEQYRERALELLEPYLRAKPALLSPQRIRNSPEGE